MNPARSGESGNYTEGTGGIGGWEKSEMRKYLESNIKPLIPENVRNKIKKVKKTQTAYNTSGGSFEQTTEDDVWIPDYNEVYGSSAKYKTLFPDNASRVKKKVDASSAYYWWLRRAINTFLASAYNLKSKNPAPLWGRILFF